MTTFVIDSVLKLQSVICFEFVNVHVTVGKRELQYEKNTIETL